MSSITSRSADDTKLLTFRWPTADAVVTGTVSLDGADYVDITGEISFDRTVAGNHYYTLAYDPADRTIGEGTASYLMTDGVNLDEFILNITPAASGGGVTYIPPSAADADCSEQNNIPARQTAIDGCPVLPKLQCHEVQMGQDARLIWQFKNLEGDPVNLHVCDLQCSESIDDFEPDFDSIGTPSCTVTLRMREATGNCSQDIVHVIDVEIVDAASGTVRSAALPAKIVRAPGLYIEEWGVFTPDTRMLFSNQCCTFVRRGLFGLDSTNNRNQGPPTLEEIRLALRDNSAADNLLLDDVEFDAAEIAQAVIRPINYWNEIPPPIRPIQTTKTFPFKEIWMLGIQSYLLETAAHHYRRNHLTYQAGGVAVDDKNKEQTYAAKANEMRVRFQELARAKKIEINISLFSGSIGSAYSGLFH
jgi:hypothetical protein